MKPFQDWLKEQREIESKATPGPWRSNEFRIIHNGSEDHHYFNYEKILEMLDPDDKNKIRDTILICQARNNYRNMLDALEIAVKALSTITLTENDAADVYVNYRRDVTLKQIKENLGVE